MSEISVLVEYNVIKQFCQIIKNQELLRRNPKMVQYVTHFFKRVLNQIQQPWIFFNATTLSILNEFN